MYMYSMCVHVPFTVVTCMLQKYYFVFLKARFTVYVTPPIAAVVQNTT